MPDEAAIGVDVICPSDPPRSSTRDCDTPGRCHELNLEPDFRAWAEREYGSGSFRWCVNEFTSSGGYEVAACAAP